MLISAYSRPLRKYWRLLFAILLPLAFLPLAISSSDASRCGYVLILMALFWMLEILPMAMTSLMPIALFPLLGVMSTASVCSFYMKDTIFMFVCSIIYAIAMEHCELHRRIALRVLILAGSSFDWIITGFMFTTGFLSMWITNTASTAVMLPIAMEIVKELSAKNEMQGKLELEEENQMRAEDMKKKCIMLSLCIAYSANCGGMGTITGTSPNLILSGIVDDLYPNSGVLTYASWMAYNVPCVILCIAAIRVYMQIFYFGFRSFRRQKTEESDIRPLIRAKYEQLGPMKFNEKAVSILFISLIIAWLTRDLNFVPGWQDLFKSHTKIRDATSAVLWCLFLFLIPENPRDMNSSATLLDWKTAQAKLPWWLFLLVGGGFALAEGSKVSGLSEWMTVQLTSLDSLPSALILSIIALFTAFLTEIVSNPMAATLLLPVVAKLSVAVGVHPFYLMIPVTTCCSFAFMLPIATAPNAMAYEASNMSIFDMVKAGALINVICVVIEIAMIHSLGVAVFGLNEYPSWAIGANITNLE